MLRFFSIILIVFVVFLQSCGKAYFPIELKTASRSERGLGQQNLAVELISLTEETVTKANLTPYIRRVVKAGDLNMPARVIPVSQALKENFPIDNDPGPYVLGVGDELTYTQIVTAQNGAVSLVARKLFVSDDGFINIYEIGKVKAEGFTQAQLEDRIYRKLIENGKQGKFELIISGFNSKKIYVNIDNLPPRHLQYTNQPIFLESVLSVIAVKQPPGLDSQITLMRNGSEFVFSLVNLLKISKRRFRVYPNDRIFISPLNYRKETVLLVGETGAQRAITINSFQRPTLSDTIFNGIGLNNITSDFSQIYVIRGKGKNSYAYHLDITNPARISLASTFEMRPDDIVFIGTQPLSLYSRALSQILGSSGLTIQARDQVRSELR